MKQQHSFHRNFFHLVFSTKNREHLIESPEEGRTLAQFFELKAHDLDAYLEEFGCWRDHVHLLVRVPPKLALADLYGQMKGFSVHAWRKRNPDRPFKWQDGVYSVAVDPDNSDGLRKYIREQWNHHDNRTSIPQWESPDPSPKGMP